MFAYSWSFYFNCASLIDFKSWWFNVKAFLLHFKVLVQYGERKSNILPIFYITKTWLSWKKLTRGGNLTFSRCLGVGNLTLASMKTRTAKSMRLNDRMQNPVFSEIADGSEHSESKFYYPSELSDAELLRSPTHSESTERKSTLLSHDQKPTTSKQAVK